MTTFLRPLRTALRVALLAFALLGAYAAVDLFTRTHVREFQAGPPSDLAERLTTLVPRAALEGLGFGALALLLAVAATLVHRLRRRCACDRERYFGALWIAIGAFAVWAARGTYYAGEYLPFLDPVELLALNLLGFAALFVAGLVLDTLVAGRPAAQRVGGGARGVGVGLALITGVALLEGVRAIEIESRPLELGLAALGLLSSVPLSLPLAHWIGRPLDRFAARLGRGPLLPRALSAAALLGLAACTLGLLLWFRPTAPAIEVQYERLTSTAQGPLHNVVYIVVDTLRADALSCYGYDRPTSPFLDSLAAAGVRFADMTSAAPWTKPSTGTLLTGLYPSRHGAVHHGSMLLVPEGDQTLAEVFREAGYATAGFVTNPNVKAVFGFDRGFQQYFDSPVEDNTSLAAIRNSLFGRLLILLTRYQFNWNYENDVLAMNQYILPWLRTNGGERFFLYLHYIDPHSPYAPPAQYRRMFERDHGFPLHNERKRLVGRDLYDGEIRYTDHGLEQLVEALREVGALDETLFVLTSDHGEEWYEFEAVGHGYSLYQPVVGVPLILHGPGLAPGTVVEEPVQMVDLPATVLELAGLGRQTLGDGRSFAPAARGQEWQPNPFLFLENEFGMGQTVDTDFLHWGVRQGPYKLVRTVESLFRPPGRKYPERELYDLRRDPGEQQNLYDELEHEERVDGLERALDGHLEFLRTRGLLGQDLSGQMGEISPALRAQLEQLGYMVPPAANDGQR